MNEKGSKRPVRGGRDASARQAQCRALSLGLRQGVALSWEFNRFVPARVIKIRHPRLIPSVVVELGELVGLIYRSDKTLPGWPRAYIHVMQDPPRLVSNVDGTQLYIVGGSYRVTRRGIEG